MAKSKVKAKTKIRTKTRTQKTAEKKAAPKKASAKKKTAKKAVAPKAVSKKKSARKTAVKKTVARGPAKAKPVVSPVLTVGQVAPWGTVVDENGAPVSLESFRGKTVVLYFYPKDDTPGCTQESCDFRDHFAALQSDNVVVLGVSKDSPSSHVRFKNKYHLPFSLLSDEAGDLCESFGVWKEKSMYGRSYMGIERTTFVIDSEGRIAGIYPKVSVTGHVDQVLADLKQRKV